jgi:hypothetical protein
MGLERVLNVARPAVAGYTLVLPPGWARIPVRHGTAAAVRAVVEETLKQVPKSVPRDTLAPYHAELEGRLREMARQARGRGGVDLYLPVATRSLVPVSASFVVSEGQMNAPRGSAEQMVAYLAAQENGERRVVTVDDGAAVRAERVAGPESAVEVAAGSRRVEYMIPVPGEHGRWVFVVFSTLGAGNPDDEMARALTALFDAIMSTFRWQREPAR